MERLGSADAIAAEQTLDSLHRALHLPAAGGRKFPGHVPHFFAGLRIQRGEGAPSLGSER